MPYEWLVPPKIREKEEKAKEAIIGGVSTAADTAWEGIKTGAKLLKEYNDWVTEQQRPYHGSFTEWAYQSAKPARARKKETKEKKTKKKPSEEAGMVPVLDTDEEPVSLPPVPAERSLEEQPTPTPTPTAKPGVSLGPLQAALAAAVAQQNVERPASQPGSPIEAVPDIVERQRQIRQAYMPYLDWARHGHGVTKWVGILGHLLTASNERRERYHQELEKLYETTAELNQRKEEQKRLKQMADLQQEKTLVQLAEYKRSQRALSQLAKMATLYGDKVFTDPKINMGMRMLAGIAGNPNLVPPLARPERPNMPTYGSESYRYLVFADEYRKKNPRASEAEIIQAYNKVKTNKEELHRPEDDLLKTILPTDPTNQTLSQQKAAQFIQELKNPNSPVSQYIQENGLDRDYIAAKLYITYPELFQVEK